MKLGDEELKNMLINIEELPFLNMSEDNQTALKSVINELLDLRTTMRTPKRVTVQIPKGHVVIDKDDSITELKDEG